MNTEQKTNVIKAELAAVPGFNNAAGASAILTTGDIFINHHDASEPLPPENTSHPLERLVT